MSKQKIITLISSMVIIIFEMIPILKDGSFPFHSFVNYGLLISFLILMFFNIKNMLSLQKYFYLYFVVFCLTFMLELFVCFTTINVKYLKTIALELLFLLAPIFVYFFLERKYYKLLITEILFLVIVDNFLLILFGTILKNPIFIRSQVAYSTVYMTAVFLPLFCAYSLKQNRANYTRFNTVRISIIVLSSISLLLAGFMISIVSLFVSMLVFLVLIIPQNNKSKIIALLLTILPICFFLLFAAPLLKSIANIMYNVNKYYYERILDIANLFSGKGFGNALGNRLAAYKISINSITKHPIFGVAWNISDYTETFVGVSYHSTILDNFALYGAFLGFPVLFLLFSPFFCFPKCKKSTIQLVPFVIALFTILLFDNLAAPIGPIAYFLAFALNNDYQMNYLLKEIKI